MTARKIINIRAVSLAVIASLGLAACEPMSAVSGISNVERVNFQDNCAPLRQPFAKIRDERNARFAGAAITGAVIGAVGTLLLGGDAKQAAAGGLVGGLTGFAAAYVSDAQRRGATQSNLRAFLERDARNEAAQNDRLVNQLKRLNACRLDQADKIRRDVRDGRLTRAQGKGAAREIRRFIAADRRAVNAVAGSRTSYQAYVGVLNESDQRAAQRTQAAVSKYQPSARTITRTSRGRPAFQVAARPSAPTNVAASEMSRSRLDAAAKASNDAAVSAVDDLIAGLDSEVPI